MDLPGPTDVLAFPMDELDLRGSRGAGHAHEEKSGEMGPAMLGDVILCPPVAEQQAREAGHALEDELDMLTTHGILHLLGFDHEEPEEHAEMFGLQGTLLTSWKASRNP
jgi:probable rRNA maturation factor